MLPAVELPSREVHGVTVYGLTRSQALALKDIADQDVEEIEVALLTASLRSPEADVRAWYANAPSNVVEDLLAAAAELSGLGPEAERPTPEG